MEILFFAILIFIFLDFMVLKRRARELFLGVFSLSVPRQIVYSIIFLAGLAASLFPRLDSQVLFSFLTVFVFTLYLGGRVRFKEMLRRIPAVEAEPRPKLVLASESLELLLLWFLWMVVGSVLLKVAGGFLPGLRTGIGELAVLSMYSSCVMVGLIYRLTKNIPGLSFGEVSGLRRNRQSLFKLGLLPFLLGAGLAVATGFLMMSRPVEPQTPFGQMMESVNTVGMFLTFLAAAVFLAPFFEEVIFRGFFFHVIRTLSGRFWAVVAVAGLFGLMHVQQYWGDGLAIMMVALLGLMLTLLRAWTGSSIPGIVAHYAFNSTMTIMPLLFVLLSNPFYFEYQVRYLRLNAQAKEALLLKSIQRYPQHAASYNDLAWLYAEQGKNLGQALILADRALAYEPGNYAFWDTKAEVLFKMGRVNEAVAIEQRLLDRFPGHPLLQKQLQKFRSAQKK